MLCAKAALLRKIQWLYTARGKNTAGCACFFYPNTVMAVVQDSNLIPFSSTQSTTTFQTVSFMFY